MIDNTFAQLAYAFLVVAGVVFAASVAAIVVAVRDLRDRRGAGTPVIATIACRGDLGARRAA
jgi:hypothetical protein